MTKKWRDNIDKYKKAGSKVNPTSRREIIRPKSSWWTLPSFNNPESGIPEEEHQRMRHNTAGIQASDNF